MRICTECKRKAEEKVCSACGGKMVSTTKTKIGAGIRLTLLCLMVLLSGISTICAIPELFQKGIISGATDAMMVLSSLIAVSCVIFLLVKWAVFILPKSFRFANEFSKEWVALSLFGLGLKLMLWAVVLIFPFGIACSIGSSVMMAIAYFLGSGCANIFIAFLYLIVVCLIMCLFALLEVCKLTALSIKDLLKNGYAAAKTRFSAMKAGS